MTQILALSGSPAPHSRTALLAEYTIDLLSGGGFDAGHLPLRQLPAEELLHGQAEAPELSRAVDAVALADGVIVATPVAQAAYSGLLKTFLDLLPHSALAGKTVLPLATGHSAAQAMTIDYALGPVLRHLGARHVVAGCFVLDRDISRQPDRHITLQSPSRHQLDQVVDDFTESLPSGTTTYP